MDSFCEKDQRYRFDDFQVDPLNRILSRGGEPIVITGKAFDLLLVLIENPGQLLTKEKLIDAVWGTEFIEEGNVAKAVSNLRKVLGDTGREHKYIDTVHGHGYRFSAPVETMYGADGEAIGRNNEVAADTMPHMDRVGRSMAVWPGAIAILIGAALTILIWNLFSSRSAADGTNRFKNPRQTKLSQSGNVYAPTISRDGKYIAFIVIEAEDGRSIGLQRIGESGVQKFHIASGSALWGVWVAPDNHYIYYVSRESTAAHGSLFRISLAGGATRRIANNVAGFSVSPDGSRIAVIRRDVRRAATSIVMIDSEGSDEQEILRSELETAYYSLDWDPDGRNLLYAVRRQTSEGELRYVAQLPVSGGREEPIDLSFAAKVINIRWLPGKQGFIVTAVDEETGQSQLFYVSYPEGIPQRITSDVEGYRSFSMTADGGTIVTGRSRDYRSVWVTKKGAKDGLVITQDTDKHFDSVEWLGDDRLVFDEDERGTYGNRNLWSMRADGSERNQLTTGDGNNTQPTVSPDGKSIVFVSYRTGKSQLWQINADGSELTQITNADHNISFPRFGGSGDNIYYSAWVEGKNQIWRLARSSGAVSPVVEGVDARVWAVSPDEKTISYSYFDPVSRSTVNVNRDLDGVDVAGRGALEPATWLRWAPNGDYVYFNTRKDSVKGIWRTRADGSDPRRVVGFEKERAFHCAWTNDNSRVACIRQNIAYDAILIKL